MTATPRRVLIVSAAPVWRAGALAALSALPGLQVLAAEAPDAGADAYVLQARRLQDAVAWAQELPAERPVVVVTEPEDAAPAFEHAGPVGRLSLEASPAALQAAVMAVLEGLSVTERSAWSAAAWRPAGGIDHEPLTSRELEVFDLMSKGLSNKEIGGVLGISTHTAKFHVSQILAKVGASTRAEAVSSGLRMGLIGL